jgi:hypothetical protein
LIPANRETSGRGFKKAKEILLDQETQLSLGLLAAEHISSKPLPRLLPQ